jgi:hypothetical protein
VLTIHAAKEMKGTAVLPPSSDLFFLSIMCAMAARRPTRISPLCDIPLVPWWEKALAGHVALTCATDHCLVEPVENAASQITLSYEEMPYRDFIVFLLLGLKKTLLIDPLPPKRLAIWEQTVAGFGCGLSRTDVNGRIAVSLTGEEHFRVPDTQKPPDLLHPLLGICLGLKKSLSVTTPAQFASPLRHVLPLFGWDVSVATNLRDKKDDPLLRRMRFLQSGKKSEEPLHYIVSADFSHRRDTAEVAVTVPGDDVLGAAFIAGKCLVPRGSLVIGNMGLESWNTQTLQLVKKMGGLVATQETGSTSYGAVGTVTLQKTELSGRKVECRPLFLYDGQLPAMVVLGAFARGQTVLRGLEDLRNDEPDAIEQILSCVNILGGRHGEMPDGIVIDGAPQYDGFDLPAGMPAPVAASFAMAGLRSMGATRIHDEAIVRRWPRFGEMLTSVCEFRE